MNSLECLEIFGDELTIVNCARVSFGIEKTEMDERDEKLIAYLVRNKHFSPFRHVFLRFRIAAPEFVMRQWYKHVVGAEWTSAHPSQLHGWNEISGRYVVQDEIYEPKTWRRQSLDNKQGSDGPLEKEYQPLCDTIYHEACDGALQAYRQLLALGVAREQARMVLPISTMTKVIWTCSLQAAIHFVRLRLDPHAQEEIREFAERVKTIIEEKFPVTWKAFSCDT